MKITKKNLFFLISFVFSMNLFNSHYQAQSEQNSIFKFFCLQSVKEEMLKAQIEYSEEMANKTCECYSKEFIETASHEIAKLKCKLEAKEKFKS